MGKVEPPHRGFECRRGAVLQLDGHRDGGFLGPWRYCGELVAPAFIVLGLFTRWMSIPAAITMAVAAFGAHAGDPIGDKEHALLFSGAVSWCWPSWGEGSTAWTVGLDPAALIQPALWLTKIGADWRVGRWLVSSLAQPNEASWACRDFDLGEGVCLLGPLGGDDLFRSAA